MRILYYSIMIFLLLVIIELCSRAYYYQQRSPHPVAAIHLIKDVKRKIVERIST